MNRCSIISLPAFWLVTIGFPVNYATCSGDETPPAPDVAITDDEAQSLLAYERFLQVLRQHPGIGTALEHVYGFHLERGTVDEFLTSLIEAEARETDGVSITIRGLVELQRGHDEEAAEILRAAEQQRLNDPMVAWALARALNRTGEFAESANALERAIERNPERADLLSIFQELNRTYRRSQQHEKAADVWNRMEKLFPNDLRVKEHIANSLYEEGDFQAALPRFQELAKLTGDPYLATQASVFAAEIMLRLDQKDEALKSFESLLNQLDQDGWLHRDIRQRIESVFVKSGDYAGLATYYESWLKIHPDDVDAMARLGRSLAYLGRFDDARKWYADALKRAPSNVGLRESMIEQLVREENYAEAIGHYEQLYKTGIATSDHIQEWGFLFISRKDLPKDQRQTHAAEVWMLLLRDKNNDAVTVSHVADLMREANLSDRAMTLYQQAITLAPDHPQYKVNLGDLYHSLQQSGKAFETWKAIAAGEQRTVENLLRLVSVFNNHGYRDEALQTMSEVVEISPEFHHRLRYARMLRANAMDGDRVRLEESLAQLELADHLAASPEDRETVLEERIRGLEDLGQLATAAEKLAHELAANQDATADRWRTLALYRDALGELPEAITAIEQAIKTDNKSVFAWKTAASMFDRAGRLNDASDAFRHLMELDDRSIAEHLQKLIGTEVKQGRIAEALQAGKQLLATSPRNPESLQTYANLCLRFGEPDEGLDTLRRAVRMNSSDNNCLQALARALVDRSEFSKAIELYWQAFDRATALEDRQTMASSLADLYLQTAQFDRLIQTLELRSRELNQRRDMLVCLSRVHHIAGDLTASREAIERLVTADSRDVSLLTNLVKLAVEQHDVQAAADYQRRINAAAPSDEGRARLADFLVQLGDLSEAEAIWMRAAESQSDPTLIFRSIDHLAASGNLDSARDLCQRILQHEPDNWEAMLRDGLFAWQQGNREQAMKSFETILAMDRDWNELSVAAKSSQNAGHDPDRSAWLERMADAANLGQLLTLSYDGRYSYLSSNPRRMSAGAVLSSHHHPEQGFYTEATLPCDFGEARVVCEAARIMNAIDNRQKEELLSQLVDRTEASADTAWECYAVLQACKAEFKLPADRERWMALSSRLGNGGTATSDDSQLALIHIFLDLRLATLRKPGFDSDAVEYGGGLICFGGGPSWQSLFDDEALDIKGVAPALSAADLNRLFAAFEQLAHTHPEWLDSDCAFELVQECRLAKCSDRLSEFVGHFSTPDHSVGQLDFALQILLQMQEAPLKQVLDVLERFEAIRNPITTLVRPYSGPASNLYRACERTLTTNDITGHQRILMLFVNAEASRSQRSASTGSALARRLESMWVLSTGSAMPHGFGGGVDDDGMSIDWKGLDYTEQDLLHDIYESWQENRQAPELDVDAWCEAQKQTADADHAFVFELVQADYHAWADEEASFDKHLLQALELSPDDQELRGRLIVRCIKRHCYAEALALLEQIPDDNIQVLKIREFEIIEVAKLALHIKNKPGSTSAAELEIPTEATKTQYIARAVQAAERLSGFSLDAECQSELVTSLRELQLTELADRLEARIQPVATARRTISDLERMAEYVKQDNSDAAAQIAQQILRRSYRDAETREAALKVLKDTGKLGALIQLQTEQLEKSPRSVVLLESLQELHRANGDPKSVIEISRRLIAARPRTNAWEVVQFANDLSEQDKNSEACDVLLKLLKDHPDEFVQNYSSCAGIFRHEGRIDEVVDTIRKMGVKSFAPNAESVFSLIKELILWDDSHRHEVSLLGSFLKESPESSLIVHASLDSTEFWQHPEMFEVILNQLIPVVDPAIQRVPNWSLALEKTFSDESETNQTFEPQGWLRLLLAGFEESGDFDETQRRILTAQKEFPAWRDGDLLLAIMDDFRGEKEAAHARIERLLNDASFEISVDRAFAVAVILQFSEMPLRLDACRLLERSLKLDQQSAIDFSKPEIVLQMMLYGKTDQAEKGRVFILKHTKIREANTATVRAFSSDESRFSAACCLRELDCGIDAGQMLGSLDWASSNELEWQFRAESFGYQDMASRWLFWVTPVNVTHDLQQFAEQSTFRHSASVDLEINVIGRKLEPTMCVSGLLQELDFPIYRSDKEQDEMRTLSEALSKSLDAAKIEPSLAVVGIYFVVTSDNDDAIAELSPALDRWLNRPVPNFESTADSEDLVRREAAEIAFAYLARKIADRPGLETISERLMDRAIAVAQQVPDKKYLSALLVERWKWMKTHGDPATAAEVLQELQALGIHDPSDLDTMAEGTVDRRRSESEIQFDLGAQVRTRLLNLSP